MKQLARGLMPPLLWRLGSRLWQLVAPAPVPMFRGVFESFAQVRDGRPWTTAAYLEASRQLLRECRAGALPPKSGTTQAVLVTLINTWPAGRTPRILDWAGGTGIRYWAAKPALARPVEWQVIDAAELASLSREIMGASDELTFAETMPPAGAVSFDIVIVYAALQYAEDQAPLLERLAGYGPRWILLARMMARHGPAYVTCQRLHGADTPCKVSSLDDVDATLRRSGYRQVLAMADGLDLSDFFDRAVPPDHRVGMEQLLVYERARDGGGMP